MELFSSGCKWVLDMDDTLAHFNKEKNAIERFAVEKDFFTNLKASKLTKLLKTLIKQNKVNINDIYIVSASPNEQADHDKTKWLNEHLNEIPKSNILFTRLGQNKGQLFIDKYHLEKKDLCNYVLIDDYTKNLIEWQKLNGKVLKYINEYNNTKQHYKDYNIQSITI